MAPLLLHDFHAARGATFIARETLEVVSSYGAVDAEYQALTQGAALIDLSARSRLCLLGADREKFLHGQVTNEVLRLPSGQGTFAALVTAKGKLESDLFIYKLSGELLLDFEPGLAEKIAARLEKYVIAEDVQIVNVAPHYGLLSVQGPEASAVLEGAALVPALPETTLGWAKAPLGEGELYLVNNPRFGSVGFDLFIPNDQMLEIAERLSAAPVRWAGQEACEMARIENGIPRFGIDMDESNLAPEALGERAISYAKGCYIGQEVIARIRTYGRVAKALRLLRLPGQSPARPAPGEKLFKDGKDAGYLTSSTFSPKHGAMVALGYVRKEANALGENVHLAAPDGATAQVIAIPGAV